MKIIAIGPDGSGKTTICKALGEDLGLEYIKAYRVADDEVMMDVVKNDLVTLQSDNRRVIYDRHNYPCDLCYEPMFFGKESVLVPMEDEILTKLETAGVVFLFCDAELEVLMSRFEKTVEDTLEKENLEAIQQWYREYAERIEERGLNVVGVDTSGSTTSESIQLAKQKLKEIVQNKRGSSEMEIATILPAPLLHLTRNDEYHMCLYQEVMENPEYAKFFRERRAEGKFVIMDNGAAEGVNPLADALLPVYPLVDPSEVVLPDVIYDKAETLRRTKEAYLKFEDAGVPCRFMAVPQGNCYTEWLECLEEMLEQPRIVTIGISKFVTPKFKDEMGPGANVRLECVDAVLHAATQRGRTDIEIHLLGCWENPKEIGEIAAAYGDRVRGTDSAIAYVYTRNEVAYDPAIERPDNDEIDFKEGTVENMKLLEDNIDAWIGYCKEEK